MKKIPLLTLASLFIVTGSLHAAPTNFISAKISGTAQTQIVLGPSDGRIGISKVDNTRVFNEFNVSATDYDFVFATGSDAGFYLLPKHTGAALPTLPVIILGDDTQTVIDTKAHIYGYQSSVQTTNNTATNLFENLTGVISGSLKYAGSFPPTNFTSASFVFLGHGTDISTGDGAILNLKLTVKGTVTQVP